MADEDTTAFEQGAKEAGHTTSQPHGETVPPEWNKEPNHDPCEYSVGVHAQVPEIHTYPMAQVVADADANSGPTPGEMRTPNG